MSPQEAKLELQRQAERLGYVGEKGRGLQRIFATLDAFIAGDHYGPDQPWRGEDSDIVRYIRELQQRPVDHQPTLRKTNQRYNELVANARPSTRPHPLEDVVRKIFADNEDTELTLTHITVGLGACSRPKRGRVAYATVAEDVLGFMTGQGKLIRDDLAAQSKHVRDGGYYWRLAEEEKP